VKTSLATSGFANSWGINCSWQPHNQTGLGQVTSARLA
jgi:hypothetical protein